LESLALGEVNMRRPLKEMYSFAEEQ